MAELKLQAQNRADIGTNRVKKLRNDNIIPGVIYSKGDETIQVQVDRKSFERTYRTAGMTTLINLEIDGNMFPVLIKELQTHPYKREILHVDFQRLKMDETIKLTLPVVLLGRDNIRVEEAMLMQHLDEVDIECLPQYIPDSAKVDVSEIDFTTPVYVSDLDIAKDENITVFNELDTLVANLVAQTQEEEEEEDVEQEGVEAGEVPVIGEEDEEE